MILVVDTDIGDTAVRYKKMPESVVLSTKLHQVLTMCRCTQYGIVIEHGKIAFIADVEAILTSAAVIAISLRIYS